MHQFVKRLFAVLLTGVFVTGSAMPLVWCVAGSDHAAIEFKIGSGRHHPAPLRRDTAQHLLPAVADKLEQNLGNCVDTYLVPREALVSQPEHELAFTNVVTPKPWADQASPPMAIKVSAISGGLPPPIHHISSQQLHLRTVILLI